MKVYVVTCDGNVEHVLKTQELAEEYVIKHKTSDWECWMIWERGLAP